MAANRRAETELGRQNGRSQELPPALRLNPRFTGGSTRKLDSAHPNVRKEYSLHSVSGGGSENFPFHFVFFPTASLLFAKGLDMIVVITRNVTVERRVVNLLAHPSLARDDG